MRFQCAIAGHPAPWIRWDKNGTTVTPSTRISIKEEDDVKILEIIDVIQEDAALYRVTAENDLGRIEASARLEVISMYIYICSQTVFSFYLTNNILFYKRINCTKIDANRRVELSELEVPRLEHILRLIEVFFRPPVE